MGALNPETQGAKLRCVDFFGLKKAGDKARSQ